MGVKCAFVNKDVTDSNPRPDTPIKLLEKCAGHPISPPKRGWILHQTKTHPLHKVRMFLTALVNRKKTHPTHRGPGKPRSTSSRSPISWSMSLWPATPKLRIPPRPAKNGRFHGRRRIQKWRQWNWLKVHYLNPVLLLLVLQTWWDLGWHYHQLWECQLGKMERKLVLDPTDPSIRCLGPSWLEIILHFHPPLQRLHLSKYDQPAEFKRHSWFVAALEG